VGGQYHAPAALPPEKTRSPLYRRLGGPQGRSGRVRKISPPLGFDPWIVQPVASRYTDWSTQPTTTLCKHANLKCPKLFVLHTFLTFPPHSLTRGSLNLGLLLTGGREYQWATTIDGYRNLKLTLPTPMLIVSNAIIRDTYQALSIISGITPGLALLFRSLTAWSWRREADAEIKCLLPCTMHVNAIAIK
jgi:hypothetical protein